MAFESSKERLAQLEKSHLIMEELCKSLDVTWEQRVALVDGSISILNSINEYKTFLEKYDER